MLLSQLVFFVFYVEIIHENSPNFNIDILSQTHSHPFFHKNRPLLFSCLHKQKRRPLCRKAVFLLYIFCIFKSLFRINPAVSCLTVRGTSQPLPASSRSHIQSCEEPVRYESLRLHSEPLHLQGGKAHQPDQNRSSCHTLHRSHS